MSNTSPQHSASGNCAPVRFLCWFTLLALLVSLLPSRADEKEDEYLRIYDLVQSADTLINMGKLRPALAKYREADTALLAFKRNYPEWNPASVSYRLNYIAVKISEVSDRITNPPATATGPAQSKAATGGSMPEVKLLELGAQPHKELRLLPKAGDKQVLELSMKPTIEAKIGEMANPPMKMPGMKVVLELTVKDVSPEGEISFQTVFTDTTA